MLRFVRTFTVLLIGTILISCGGSKSTDPQNGNGSELPAGKRSDHVLDLGYGQTTTVASEALTVTFESLLEDSRCPSDVVCVWEGRAIIGLRLITAADDTHTVNLTLYGGCAYGCSPYVPALDTLGYRFELLDLDPYPISTVQTPPEDYTATIAIFPHPAIDSVEGEVIISNDHPATIQDASFVLDSVGIEGDVLTLTIEYGGGCNAHAFELHMSPAAFYESAPVQANLYLRHTDFDDPCDAWIRNRVSFDLRPIAHLYEIQYGRLDCIRLNMHGYLRGSDPPDEISVIYRPDGSETTSWCSSSSL